ncbi:MAG TPA: ABC transporter ATP-binding protein [Xanthobacteraceae bacterium]
MSLLAVRDLRVRYGKVVALEGVSLAVEEGEVVTLVGANGAGKSTLLRAVMGLVPVAAGAVEVAGAHTTGRRAHEMARLGIGYVPEGRGTLRTLSVRENMLLGASARMERNDARGAEAEMERVLERFPALRERAGQLAGTLSGGQQQMLVIARALMGRPRLLLLDEPSLGLAPIVARTIFATIAELRAQGVTVLLVEQNAQAALALASRGYVLEMGRIVLEGAGLLGDPRVRAAYLGEIAAG